MQSSGKTVRDTGKKVLDTFFKLVEGTVDVWVCRRGTKRKFKGSGRVARWSLYCYLQPVEIGWLIILYKIAVQVHGWLQFVVHCLQPFQVVENPKFTKHIRYESLTQMSFKTYLEKFTKIVEEKIWNVLPDIFAIVFDGWTTNDSHYIAMYATFADYCTLGYKSEIQNNLNYFLEIIHFGKLNGCCFLSFHKPGINSELYFPRAWASVQHSYLELHQISVVYTPYGTSLHQ